MQEKIGFIGTIKEKPLPILGWTIGLTFLVGKVIEFIINWLLDLSYSGYGPRTIMPITIFYPIIFVIVGLKVVKHFRKKLNAPTVTDGQIPVKEKIRPDYYGNYTWRDIFKDREVFIFYIVLVIGIWCAIYESVQFISRLSTNYAISSLERTSMESLLVIAVIIAALLVVWIQNAIISWLCKTQKGNQVLSITVFLLGIMTCIAMLGISYLWENPETLTESLAGDMFLGMILPIDLTTTTWALWTGWFWNKARTCMHVDRKMINTGLLIAVVSFIISLTPLQTGIQMLWVAINNAWHSI